MTNQLAKRYNTGKLRYTLISNIALQELARVYTYGAHKYSVYSDDKGNQFKGQDIPFTEQHKYTIIEDGSYNWKLGQNWLSVMDSIKRHLEAWSIGEDIDSDLGTYHLANAMWGISTLLDYYKSYPQGDNRIKQYNRIGLTIDNIIIEDLNKEPIITKIPFQVYCYFTKYPYNKIKKWLEKYNFPINLIYIVNSETKKINYLIKHKIDLQIETSWFNFITQNNLKINTYLYSTNTNKNFYVGNKRLNNLSDI